MPLTRAMKHASSSNLPQGSTNIGTKRKADGRKILGEIGNRSNSTVSGIRKIVSGVKSVGGPLKEITGRNSRRGALKNIPQSSCSSKPVKAVKPSLRKTVKSQVYKNHLDFSRIPFEKWRGEMKDEMTRSKQFYDYDECQIDNLFESSEYSLGIFEYMKWREERFEIQPYLTASSENFHQHKITPNDRRQLIDFMVEFQELQESTHETLYLAVRICDYFFSKNQVQREHLQLYGFVGFLLAAKFEERWPPLFEDMIEMSEDQYHREDFIKAEEAMLKCLKFDVNLPISYRYLRRYCKIIGMDMRAMTQARFYLEVSLQEYEFVNESQSMMAAACLWIAMSVIGWDGETRARVPSSNIKKYWCQSLSYYTGLNEWQIVPLAQRIAAKVRQLQTELRDLPIDDQEDQESGFLNQSTEERLNFYSQFCTVVYKKYASSIFFRVAQKSVLSENDFECHLRRTNSERIDFNASREPNSKRRSTGCTAKLSKMSLRSTTPNIPERPEPNSEVTSQKSTSLNKSKRSSDSTQFFSAKSQRPENNSKQVDDKENQKPVE